MTKIYDVAIIGGGINGCGCAADAALRGLKVVLFEKDDLAAHTSSKSSKLIHGGLRYLEHGDFFLVKKALDERQLLLNVASALVHPIPLVLLKQKNLRSTWILRLGLFFYDNLSRKNRLPTSKYMSKESRPLYFAALADDFNEGFLFYDCMTDDARLTITNALQAKIHGADIYPRTKVLKAKSDNNIWDLVVQRSSGITENIKAKTLINASGPWVNKINPDLDLQSHYQLSLIQGSHIVVNKLYEGAHGYLLQHEDKRIVFVLPYHGCSLIGTTDVAFQGDLDKVDVSSLEIDYLCNLVNRHFKHKISAQDILYSWSGVRPLLSIKKDSPQNLSRDYSYEYRVQPAPAVTIYGGKITTYRCLAKDVIDSLSSVFINLGPSLTAKTVLPGSFWGASDPFVNNVEKNNILSHYPWLDFRLGDRYWQNYGGRTALLLKNVVTMKDLGLHFGHGLYQREVDFLRQEEWACTAEDILWRRTKLGLYFKANATDMEKLEQYLAEKALS